MSIKYLAIYLIMQAVHCTTVTYNPSCTKVYKEVSKLANENLKKLAFAHYENPTKEVPRANPKGQKLQYGGTLNAHSKDKDSLLKEGGVILAQSGVRANYSYDEDAERRRSREIFEKNKAAQASAEVNTSSSPESDQGLLLPNKSKQTTRENILIFGTTGLVSLFFVIATTIFCVLYTKRNKDNPSTREH